MFRSSQRVKKGKQTGVGEGKEASALTVDKDGLYPIHYGASERLICSCIALLF